MPQTEAPVENHELGGSRTSIIDWNSSESDSITLSDYELEVSVSNSLTNSSMATSITSSVSGSVSSSDSDIVTNMYTLMPVPGSEGIRIPIDFNLKQLLIKVTGTQDLDSITTLRLRVIARDFSIQRLPMYLPNLRELNLTGSCLMTLRDLGCGMQLLQVLHVCRTGLNSLDGLFGLSELTELYAAHNNIKDVSPCSALHQVKVLDLANNVIKDESTVSFLMLCTTLKHLTLQGNPATTINNYRASVKEILPELNSLDGISYFDDEDRSLNRSLKKLEINESSSSKVNIISRFPPIPKGMQKEDPAQKPFRRPSTTGSMNNHVRNKNKIRMLPLRPSTARHAKDNDFDWMVNGSEIKLNDIRQMFVPSKLTCGKPLCGNPALGLWEKKKLQTWVEDEE